MVITYIVLQLFEHYYLYIICTLYKQAEAAHMQYDIIY